MAAHRSPGAAAPFPLPPAREVVTLEPAALPGAPWSGGNGAAPVAPTYTNDGTLGVAQLLAPLIDVDAIELTQRTGDSVPIYNDTHLTAATHGWQLEPGQDTLTVIVKGSYELVDGSAALPANESDLPTGDLYRDDDPAASIRYASDFAVVKPRADVTLCGVAHAASVRFRFADAFDRSLTIKGGTPLPLIYEHAFGGEGFDENPVGKGYVPPPPDPKIPMPPPREHPRIEAGDATVAGFAPVPIMWEPRKSLVGTFDKVWRDERWPYFPADFDSAFFQAAPAIQQVPHLMGDEAFEIEGLHPEHLELSGTLPRIKARCFMQPVDGAFVEIALALDTVHFDIGTSDDGALIVHLTWRGTARVAGPTAPDVCAIYVLCEELGARGATLEDARKQFIVAQTSLQPVADDPNVDVANDADAPQLDTLATKSQQREAALAGLPPEPAMLTPVSQAPAPDVDEAPARPPAAPQAAALDGGGKLDGLDLSGVDLSGRDLSKRSLVGAVLLGANLEGAKLSGADLFGAQLGGANLTRAAMDGATLDAADLTKATLDGASFDDASLIGTDLSGARGVGISAQNTRGSKARFTEGIWQDAKLMGASLEQADFTAAVLDGASFDGAHLHKVCLYDARAHNASFRQATMTDARGDGAALLRCTLDQVDATGSVWEGAVLDESSFAFATLSKASFEKASCTATNFSRCIMVGTRFKHAKLIRGKLAGADLKYANFASADLSEADLSGANLYGAETWQAVLDKTKLDHAFLSTTKLAEDDA